jgi:lysyl-tRNA synthetase, class II
MSTPFIEDNDQGNDQTRARRDHLDKLRAMVGNVYPNKFERSRNVGNEDTITAIIERYGALEPPKAEGGRPAPEDLERANAQLNKVEVRVSGRIATPPRVMGKAAFVHLSDGQARLQIYVRKADVKGIRNDDLSPIEEGWELFNLLDHGDFIGVAGFLFVTRTGELSVHVRELQFLAKALLPMPDKMHGINDPEIRQRQRYADLIAGSLKVRTEDDDTDKEELSPREVFQRRSKLITEMRRFLDDHGYIEVETPMLTPLATGAAAKPFETYHNALGIKLYARIAPELYLKRLLVGGFEKVYELNRNFRNEGISYKHNPEFTMLEFYCSYMDVNGMMDFCEELLRQSILVATGRGVAKYVVLEREEAVSNSEGLKGTYSLGDLIIRPIYKTIELDFINPFAKMTMKEAIAKYLLEAFPTLAKGAFELSWLDDPLKVRQLKYFLDEYDQEHHSIQSSYVDDIDTAQENIEKIDLGSLWDESVKQAEQDNISPSPSETARKLEIMFADYAEHRFEQPTFIYDYPKAISPLSKASPVDLAIAERFELFIMGMECANGFSELNDPQEQRERFLEQMEQRERGDEEAMVLDEDYIRALSYGMPPAAGIGIGIDRLVMLLTNKRSIRDVILFPHMRPERKRDEQAEETSEQRISNDEAGQ